MRHPDFNHENLSSDFPVISKSAFKFNVRVLYRYNEALGSPP
jgi:hypothetical protein